MNILILEDDPERIKWFAEEFKDHTIVITNSSSSCLACLRLVSFDFLFLDHDLGGKQFVNSATEDCGKRVTDFMCERKEELKSIPKTVIHSWNAAAAIGMTKDLEMFGFNVKRIPFGNFGKSVLYSS